MTEKKKKEKKEEKVKAETKQKKVEDEKKVERVESGKRVPEEKKDSIKSEKRKSEKKTSGEKKGPIKREKEKQKKTSEEKKKRVTKEEIEKKVEVKKTETSAPKKVYRVKGSFLMGNRYQIFTKEVLSSDPKEKIYSDFGNRHKVKRGNIKISHVKELKNDEITDPLIKQLAKG